MAILRVKTFNDLLFKSIFDFSVFSTNLTPIILNKRADIEKKA